jgi:hypothetical protein
MIRLRLFSGSRFALNCFALINCSRAVDNATDHQNTRRNCQGQNDHWMHRQEGYQRPCDEVPNKRPSHSKKHFHLFLHDGIVCVPLPLLIPTTSALLSGGLVSLVSDALLKVSFVEGKLARRSSFPTSVVTISRSSRTQFAA